MASSDLDAAQFTLSDVADAAGVPPGTIKNWLYPGRSVKLRPILILDRHDRGSRGTGHVRLFTLRRVLQAAIVAELVNIGVEPRKAGPAAAKFTDSSMMASGYAGEGRPDVSRDRRPGELFKEGMTYLVVGRDARVINEDELSKLVGRETASMIVDLNAIVRRVHQRLGIDAGTAL